MTVNTNWSSPFIAKGWDGSWDSSYNSEAGNGGFIGVITQPIDYNRQYDLSPTSNEGFARIYMQAYNKSFDRSNSNIYTTLKGGNYNDQNGTGWYQNAYDVPVIQYDDSSLSTSIFDKRNEIFNNTLPTDFELSNIVSIIEKNVANSKGTITVTFSINKYYNDKGLLEEVEPKNFTIKFIGFKADDRTTSINPQLTNVENILPSQYENNLELIKNSIINNIENVCSPLDINDIEIVFNEPNNLIGTINANIKIINSKALQNGNIQQEFSLNNVVLSGFKIKKETTNIIPNIKAIQLGLFDLNINKAKEKINEEFIVVNKDKFFNEDIQLNNANEILNLEVSIQNNSLVVSFKLKANTWYDENGQLGSTEKDFKTNINGFKEENKNI